MAFLSEHYFCGVGVQADHREAFRWALAAAQSNYAPSMATVASFYEKGDGVAQSYQAAGAWYLRAAQAGNTQGYNGVLRIYKQRLYQPESANEAEYLRLEVQGVKAFAARQYRISLENSERAAKLGWTWGARSVGVHYEFGDGVPINYQTALTWYQSCSKSGNEACTQSYRNLSQRIGANNNQKALAHCPRTYTEAGCSMINIAAYNCLHAKFPNCPALGRCIGVCK
jgi:TPR repeat protein